MSSTYILSCHCQAHVYILTLPAGELEQGAEVCDCSWCLKRRLVWGFYSPDSLVLHRGAGKDCGPEMAEYWFGAKNAAHKFCRSCGTFLIMEHNRPDTDKWFVNLRAIRNPDFDLWKLPLTVDNSAGIAPPEYKEISLVDIPGAEDTLMAKSRKMGGETEIYTGTCHCQAVKFAMVCRPLHSDAEERIVDCACSICLGNGVLWLYPQPSQVIFHPSEPSNPHKPLAETVVRYAFASKQNIHYMCRTCGCHVYEHREDTAGSSMGLNVALFSRAKEWKQDIHGIQEGTKQFEAESRGSASFKGLFRDDTDRWIEPRYEVKL